MARKRNAVVQFESKKFAADLHRGLERVGEEAERRTEDAANRVHQRAVSNAPVLTGRLRRSIKVKRGKTKRGPHWDIGTNLKYAPPVEFGPDGKNPQPFLRTAFAQVAAELRSRQGA